MSQPQETPTTDVRRGGFGPLAWVLAMVLIVYPLTTGPVWKLAEHKVINSKALIAYAPVWWLVKNCEPARDFFTWYLEDIWAINLD